ncbi:MAG TPA: PAS domain S-box protein [Thermoplasmata archaeon]|nr:PAS domain S-box protein [Thermoplasmata archaeon]
MSLLPTLEELKRSDTSHDLILSLTPNQEIIQFNKESERFTGFLRDEVIHKKLSEILIPPESASQWKDLLVSIQQDMWIDNFVLPLKTKANQVHMITWTGFLVKDEQGVVKDICIFGKPVQTEPLKQPDTPVVLPEPQQNEALPQEKEPVVIPEPPEIHEKVIVPSISEVQDEPQPLKTEVLVKHGAKKILFAHEKSSTNEQAPSIASEKPSLPVQPKASPSSAELLEKQYNVTSHKLDSILQSLSDLSQKYETVLKRVTELEKKEEPLEKHHKPLQNPPRPQPPQTETPAPSIKDRPAAVKTRDEAEQQPDEREHTFFSDPFGLKRQHTELDLKKQRVDLRMKQLETFETRLMKEKDLLHARVKEFSRWQEKLMALESEIEKRRQELMNQENLVLRKRPQPLGTQQTFPGMDHHKNTEGELPACDDETLEKIPQSAAIIQRGILKQINGLFLELLGYSPEELVEKSYFDFIALEGLADVEKYYLDRLKGESVSVYRTVFSAKDDKKIPVEVCIKQTIYNGEKAEIAIVSSLDSGSE